MVVSRVFNLLSLQCNKSIKSVLWLLTVPKTVIAATKKSAAESHIKEVYTNTFREMVTESRRNVFILFYSPVCRHCIAFMPMWKELSYLLRDEDVVDIVRIDATKNKWPESQYSVDGYPTVFWKTKSKKPELYNGDPSTQEMLKYVARKVRLSGYDENGKPITQKIK